MNISLIYLILFQRFQGRNLTNISIHPILFLESPIVEISDLDKLLLVSNYTKCILCNTESEEFKQVSSRLVTYSIDLIFIGFGFCISIEMTKRPLLVKATSTDSANIPGISGSIICR